MEELKKILENKRREFSNMEYSEEIKTQSRERFLVYASEENRKEYRDLIEEMTAGGKLLGDVFDRFARTSYKFIRDDVKLPGEFSGDFMLADDLHGKFVPESKWGEYLIEDGGYVVLAADKKEGHIYKSVEEYLKEKAKK